MCSTTTAFPNYGTTTAREMTRLGWAGPLMRCPALVRVWTADADAWGPLIAGPRDISSLAAGQLVKGDDDRRRIPSEHGDVHHVMKVQR